MSQKIQDALAYAWLALVALTIVAGSLGAWWFVHWLYSFSR